jgi:hypothetical protein
MQDSIEQVYNTLNQYKATVVERCEGYAEWTLPSIFPREGNTESDELQYDVQSFGAQAVNHLSNKLMIGLFNPSKSFFRLDAAQDFLDEMELAGVTVEVIQSALQGAEREAVKELDRLGAREPFTMILQLLIVTGNALLHFPKDGKLEVHTMRDYVIERDITGFVTRMVLLDSKKFRALTQKTQDQLLAINPNHKPVDDIKLYTDVLWDHSTKKYTVHQYADNVQITDDITKGVYTKDTVPYVPLVWKLVRGANWGKGLVEDYAGDFHSLSTAERSSLEIVGVLAQIKGLVNPAGLTDVAELNNTENGQWCSGREEDISLLSFDKLYQSMSVLESYIEKKERRLSKAFLMDAAGVRDAERVTAEEIRLVARDLEMSLGGVYTRLAQTFQLPIAKLLLERIDFTIKGEQVEPIITTGLTALSRSGDLDSYRLFLQDASLLGQVDEGVRAELDVQSILSFLATNNNFDLDVAFKSPEQKQADQEAQAAAEEQAVQDEVRMKAEPQLIAQQNEAQ